MEQYELDLEGLVVHGEFYFYPGTNHPITTASEQPNDPMEFEFTVDMIEVYLGEEIDQWHELPKSEVDLLHRKYFGKIEAALLKQITDDEL
jgi:hypothetical protein